MKICTRVFFNAEGRMDGQAERYDEANSRFRNFADAIKQNDTNPDFHRLAQRHETELW
jgi:hypothetical protein